MDDEEFVFLVAPLSRGFDVRLQDQLRRNPMVGKEAIHCFEPSAIERARQAQARVDGQFGDETSQPRVQSLVLEI